MKRWSWTAALSVPLLLALGASGSAAGPAQDVLFLTPISDPPLATLSLHHDLPHHPHASASESAPCDKDVDLVGTIAGVVSVAAQNNGICTSADIDVYTQGGSVYAVQAGGEEAAFTITRINPDGTPTLVTQRAWQTTSTYTPDVKAFKQGDQRYIALSLERLALGNSSCGVVIIDVTNPANITSAQIVAQVTGSGWCDVHNSFVENDANGDGRYIYLTADAPRDMRVLDIGNLASISEIGRYTHPQAGGNNLVHDVTVIDHGGNVGRRVYVSYWAAGLMILDAATVTPGVTTSALNPDFSIDPDGFLTHHAFPTADGSRAFIQDEFLSASGNEPVQMWDVSNVASPSYVDGIALGSDLMPVVNPAHNLEVRYDLDLDGDGSPDQRLYVGWYKAGLQAFDFDGSGFLARRIYHQVQTEAADDAYDGAWGVRLATIGSDAYVFQSDRRYGLIVDRVDICSAAANPGASDVDGDGVVDACDPGDFDLDGFSDRVEYRAGTDPAAACASSPSHNAYPADINNDTFTDIADIVALAGSFVQAVPPAPARHDIDPDPQDGIVDILDIVRMADFFGQSCAGP